MLRLSIEEMIQRIGKGIAFEAEARDRSFRINEATGTRDNYIDDPR